MTKDQAQTIVNTSVRCTQAALRAFNIEGIPHTGSGCLSYLTAAGFTVHLVAEDIPMVRFKFDASKNYLIATKGHAMAMIDGVLIDTMNRTVDKRIIQQVWVVSPSGKE